MTAVYVDLPCHSTASDGTLSPSEVVRLAQRNGLTALSLTDHHTMAGTAEAGAEAAALGVEFLPGIEISAEYPRPGTLHILGYGIDQTNPVLVQPIKPWHGLLVKMICPIACIPLCPFIRTSEF